MKYGDTTEKIIKAAFKVHRALGHGFQEAIYQRALEMELQKEASPFVREFEMPVYYEGIRIGTRRVDFWVQQTAGVELNAILKPEDVHLAQAMNYPEAYNLKVGLLTNFGAKSLEFKRLTNRKHPAYIPDNPHWQRHMGF